MEEKINLLYNFLYNDSFNNCFDIEKIILGKINIDHIKITNEIEAMETLKEIVNSKLSFMNFNNEDNIILLKRFSDTFPVTVKIGTYTDDINNLSSPSNNDALFSYLLSQLIINKQTTHILLPIVNFDIKYEKIEPLLKNLPVYKSINEKVEFNEIKNILSVRVREHFFQSKILKEYLQENKCDFKQVIFQIIHTLAVIQKEFPGFRHNNLSIDNVMIYLKKKEFSENIYVFGNHKWIIPNIGFDIKITNFEKATLPKYYGVKNQRDTDVPFINEINQYFDLHTFMNSLIEKILPECDIETKKFIDKIIPVHLRGIRDKKYYLNKNENLFKPSDLLKDSYFSKYKVSTTEKKEEEKVEIVKTENLVEANTYLSLNKKMGKMTIDTENYEMLFNSKNKKSIKQKGGGEYENPLEVDKPDSFKTNDAKNVDNINNPPPPPYKPGAKPEYKPGTKPEYKPGTKPEYKPGTKPEYKPRAKPEYKPGPKPWEPGHPKYDPNYKVGPKPWEPGHPKYDPNYKPKPKPQTEESEEIKRPSDKDNVRKIRDYDEENANRVKEKPHKIPDDYKPEETPWSPIKKISSEPIRKPREEPPKIIYPEEDFKETKNYSLEKPQMVDIPPGVIPLYDPDGTMLNHMMPYGSVKAQPINKIYNISLSDPLGNHSVINQIYEDVLPSDKVVYTFITLKEREVIKKFLRNSILDKYDGEEFSIQGGEKSLLSWIKIYDVNPYARTSNPYQDLPYGFLLYRSAYPIRYNKTEGGLKSTPTSIGINIRIYQMSLGASKYNLISKPLECEYFDQWRDIIYYREIDKIIKEKVSPNFINLLLYVFDNESDAGFKQVDIIKQTKEKATMELQKRNNSKINQLHNLTINDIANNYKLSSAEARDSHIKDVPMKEGAIKIINPQVGYYGNIINPEVKKDLQDITTTDKKVLIALTESPNNNIIRWNSKIYQSYGSLQRMSATGYHNPNVWRSILFQFVHACGILENKQIYINNFNLEDNVYIKDVATDNTGNNCWLYKVNNIEYFVPNYGYLLTIDSKYADIKEETPELQFKIYGDIYKHNGSKTNFGEMVKNALKNMMSKDQFTIHNANDIDDEVNNLITKIKNELDSSNNILSILPKCFPELFNNKIGKLVNKLEKTAFNIFNKPNYIEGNLMIRQKRFDEYDWVIYKNKSKENNKRNIIYKDDKNNFVETEVFASSLFSYPEPVKPDEINIIETYIS